MCHKVIWFSLLYDHRDCLFTFHIILYKLWTYICKVIRETFDQCEYEYRITVIFWIKKIMKWESVLQYEICYCSDFSNIWYVFQWLLKIISTLVIHMYINYIVCCIVICGLSVIVVNISKLINYYINLNISATYYASCMQLNKRIKWKKLPTCYNYFFQMSWRLMYSEEKMLELYK